MKQGHRILRLELVILLLVVLIAVRRARGEDPPREAIRADRIREHVAFLASDELSGRDSGEPGLEVAAEYIANQFRAFGLAPAGDGGTYFQQFTIPFGADFGRVIGAVVLDSNGGETQLAPGVQVVPFGYGEGGNIVEAPVTFAGYGVTAREEERKAGLSYDDYAGIDVKGKAVIILRYLPGGDKGPFGDRKNPGARLVSKLRNARDHGAAAAILVAYPGPGSGESPAEGDLRGIAHRAAPRQPTLPAILARPEAVDDMLARTGRDLESLVQRIDGSSSPCSFEVPGVRVRLDTAPGHRTLRNVSARIAGAAGTLEHEAIVVGAHYDHIGRFGNQVAPKHLGSIHNGADDNASGTAGLLELARVFAKSGGAPGRAVVFVCFSGEEIGLLGSRAWLDARRRYRVLAETPCFAGAGGREAGSFGQGTLLEALGGSSSGRIEVKSLATGASGWVRAESLEQVSGPEAPHRIAAMVNLDMVGRAKQDSAVSIIGSDTSPQFPSLVEGISKTTSIPLQVNEKGLVGGGSDHASFIARGIPALFFFTGMHPQYNTPADDTETLNYEGERRVLEVARGLIEALARMPERPTFNASVARSSGGHGKLILGVLLDSDYAGGGARVQGTSSDTPAARAGIKEGDVIVAVRDKPIRAPQDLIAALEDLPEDEEVPFKLQRGGKMEVVKVIFPARRGGFRVSFGSVPDYGFAGRGVRFEGIRDGSPAAKAGVMTGDVLVRWGDKEVEDVEQWTALLGAHKPGDEVTIEVRRGDAKLQLKVKLEARE